MKAKEICEKLCLYIKNNICCKDDLETFITKAKSRIEELESEKEIPLLGVFDHDELIKYFKLEDGEKARAYANQEITKKINNEHIYINISIHRTSVPKSQVELLLEKDSAEKEYPQITKLSDLSIEDFDIYDLYDLMTRAEWKLEFIESEKPKVKLLRVSPNGACGVPTKYFKLEDKAEAFAYAKQYFNDKFEKDFEFSNVFIETITINPNEMEKYLSK